MIHLAAINRIPNISAETKRRIAAIADGEDALRHLCADRKLLLSCLDGYRGRKTLESFGKNGVDAILSAAAEDLDTCSKRAIEMFHVNDSRYPGLLKEIHDPPFVIYVRGSVSALAVPAIGIVGTRQPSGAGREAAGESAATLAASGICVVSGLARGIDRCAHEGVLRAGGHTVGVLGSGVDLVYPASSKRTAAAILERGGALVSEYAPGIPPAKFRFPERNRIICGLSSAVLVIEAPEKSGALITADFCLDYNRELFFHRCGITGGTGCGALRYIQDGAELVDSAGQMLNRLGIDREIVPSRTPSLMERLESDLAGIWRT